MLKGVSKLWNLSEVLSEKLSTTPTPSKKQLLGELESAVPVSTFLYLARLLARNRDHIIDMALGENNL